MISLNFCIGFFDKIQKKIETFLSLFLSVQRLAIHRFLILLLVAPMLLMVQHHINVQYKFFVNIRVVALLFRMNGFLPRHIALNRNNGSVEFPS